MTVVSHYQNLNSANAIPLSQMLRPQTIGGKVALNVIDFSVYTNYKHITATPTASNGVGYSASRLRILDILIDRLVQMKEGIHSEVEEISTLDRERLDALIQEYAQRYRALSSRGLEALSEEKSPDFGVHDSKNALFLDFRI